jgi:hypothetical protein
VTEGVVAGAFALQEGVAVGGGKFQGGGEEVLFPVGFRLGAHDRFIAG